MTLNEWADKKGLNGARLARLLDTTPMSVSRYLRGERKPSWKMLDVISHVTEGKVMANDFMDNPYERG